MAEDKQELNIIGNQEGFRAEVESNNGLDMIVNKKTLYHGSATEAIISFNLAEEDTVGSGIYFTSEPKDAIGYAQRRSRGRKDASPTLYEVQIENLRLANLKKNENVREILVGFKEVLKQKLSEPNLKWYHERALQKSIETINQGKVGSGNLRDATFNVTNTFTQYLESLGYDGLITFEGGEGAEVGNHDTYLIFDPKKIKIINEQKIT